MRTNVVLCVQLYMTVTIAGYSGQPFLVIESKSLVAGQTKQINSTLVTMRCNWQLFS